MRSPNLASANTDTKVPSFEMIEQLAKSLDADAYELFLPESLASRPDDQKLRVLMRDIDRHGTPEKKRFMAEVLAAARHI